MPEEKPYRLGEILIEQKIITEADLQEALSEQKVTKNRLGRILIGKGLASPGVIMNALFLKLGYGPQEKEASSTLSFTDRLRNLRIPIKVKLAVFMTALIVITMAFLSYFYFSSQRAEFLKQTMRLGQTIVGNLAHNSSVALLENDDASLHILLEEVSKIEDIYYAMVVGKTGTIRAHTDINRADKAYEPLKAAAVVQKTGKLVIREYTDGGNEILDFARPIEFSGIFIGEIHVGISLEALQKRIARTRLFVISLTLLILLTVIGLSYAVSKRLSKRIDMIVDGTRAIKNGNFDYRINIASNDEIGDLTSAFNDMADGLRKKDVIQDAFGKYVTPEIVEMILQHPDEKWFKGEMIDVTVMFADIRGFTAFTERTQPEDVVNVLNEHFTMATDIILKYGGHVDKFIGDEVLAVFGALVKHEDHAVRAVAAALALQNALGGIQTKMEKSGGESVKMGMGINTGKVVAGNIGSDKRMEYTVIGDTVNLASRLTRLAGPGEIIIADAVYQKISNLLTVEKLDPVIVKGKSEPVQTYRVVALSASVSFP